jgi:hypothetical protein
MEGIAKYKILLANLVLLVKSMMVIFQQLGYGLAEVRADDDILELAKRDGWKPIKYECPTDDNFEFYKNASDE